MKTAFITGASRGIGRAIARQLALDGYRVGINYLKEEEKANALVSELRALGCEAIAVQADVSDADAITAAIRAVERTFSPVDLLVNNAGIAQQDLFQYTDAALWRRLFAVNVDGAYN
ncbi:MAG: SDR family NAD(P)-dependent oxidoreductase, partial [Oscillospiraceae bacterium]|nr:SDR family NAD(P)-dependent oxidoreductase [Oscillospiraceae bacterium]